MVRNILSVYSKLARAWITRELEFTAEYAEIVALYAELAREIGGPARTRTWDQGIHSTHSFLNGADYLITLDRIARGGTL